MRFFRLTAVQTFLLVPLATVLAELALHAGELQFDPPYVLLMAWGYGQYAFLRRWRLARAGGGHGLSTPPERLVTTGIYAWTRNPMYLGHVIYMIGVALVFRSWIGAAIAAARAVWFHYRVLGDERNLAARFGEPYGQYLRRVKRWVPGVF